MTTNNDNDFKKRNWFQRTFIPFYIKTPNIIAMSPDRQFGVEKIGYIFGWSWKTWKFAKLTGKFFKFVRKVSPELAEDHYAATGEDLMTPAKPENKIVYDVEDFTPHEFETYFEMNTGWLKKDAK